MARGFSARLKDVTSGYISHLVIIKDNQPAAVLVGIDAYQAMQDEIEDLRSELAAIGRLPTLGNDVAIGLEEMEARFR